MFDIEFSKDRAQYKNRVTRKQMKNNCVVQLNMLAQ